ncbi:MFS transporter [Metallosphaera hakonensis]|uniref:MFS transporter n=1 Tax=Metallosphaera hakonensis JCM 8857 = DSM 7519 TaxID=1293036 RepID=A0A2U9IR09_9CREN|nr:MFS transporter [Metallosphaera hakonensis]AWR98397.1 MFS transporter [Metallosphaera hakonensis JCM 8857 = DSM 7519]
MLRQIFSLLTIFLLAALSVYSISFVLPSLSTIYGKGIYFTVPLSWIGGAIGGVALSILADRWSRRFSLLISILLFTLPLLLNSVIRDLSLFYVLWFLIGFGVNGENGLSYVYAAELSPPKYRGLVGSIMQGLYFVGGLLGLIWASVFKLNLYFLSLGVVSLISLALWPLIPESTRRSRSNPSAHGLFKITFLGAIFSVGSFLFVVPLVSLSFTLLSLLNLNAFLLLSIALLVGMVGFTLAGRISDIWGRKRTTYMFIGVSLVFSVVMLLSGEPLLVEISLVALMVGSSFFAYFGIWMSEIFPPEIRATGTNTVFFLGRLIGGGFGVSLVLLMPFGLKDDLGISLVISSILVLIAVLGLPETVSQGRKG